ncbi:hypothetical protein T07_2647 [Trichinella nelsoni]|uniref:Uncharacterized protein n=1 Tax=Trichinella nelsoni TaxID=6336 RepID=A0A0V0RPB8_9BILA|nr:hypothetical protein T07_2647 [Trichinella nelsoni]
MDLEWYTAGPPIQHPLTLMHLPTTPSTTQQSCEAEREAKSSQLLEQLFGHLAVDGWRAHPISIHNDAPSYLFIHHSSVALYRPHILPVPILSYVPVHHISTAQSHCSTTFCLPPSIQSCEPERQSLCYSFAVAYPLATSPPHMELFTRRPLLPQPTDRPARTTSIHTDAPFHHSLHNSLGSVYLPHTPPAPIQCCIPAHHIFTA